MIILEGPDGAGKTYLAESLMKRYPELTLHPKFVGSDFEGRENMIGAVVDDAKFPRKFDLYDRHPFISEYVMSTALSRPLAYGFAHPSVRQVRRDFLARALTILVLPPFDLVRDRVTADHANQPKEVWWNIRGIYTGYESLIVTHPFPWGLYRYDSTNPHSVNDLDPVIRGYLKGDN